MNAVSRVSSLSLALPVSSVPFSSSLFIPLVRSLSPFLALSRSRSLSRAFSLWSFSLASVLFRAQLSQPFYFAISFPRRRSFFSPFRPICSPSLFLPAPQPSPSPTSPLFRPLRARFSGFSCAPFRPPAYPLRNRSTETCSGVAGTNENATEGMGWHMRSGRFKGTPQERDATATRCIATRLSSSVFSRFPLRHCCSCLPNAFSHPRTDPKVGSF